MSERTIENNRIKIYASYKTLEEALLRKNSIVEKAKEAVNTENEFDTRFKYEYLSDQIISTADGDYKLEITIKKENI